MPNPGPMPRGGPVPSIPACRRCRARLPSQAACQCRPGGRKLHLGRAGEGSGGEGGVGGEEGGVRIGSVPNRSVRPGPPQGRPGPPQGRPGPATGTRGQAVFRGRVARGAPSGAGHARSHPKGRGDLRGLLRAIAPPGGRPGDPSRPWGPPPGRSLGASDSAIVPNRRSRRGPVRRCPLPGGLRCSAVVAPAQTPGGSPVLNATRHQKIQVSDRVHARLGPSSGSSSAKKSCW